MNNHFYLGGNFKYISDPYLFEDTLAVNGIARWNGESFSPIGNACPGCDDYSCTPILSIFRYEERIYCSSPGAVFGDIPAKGIVRWDGISWDSVGGGLQSSSGSSGLLLSQLIWNDALIVGGNFRFAGGLPTYGLAKWEDETWQAIPFPSDPGFAPFNANLTLFNDELYVGGNFIAYVDGIANHDILKYDGEHWHSIFGGLKGALSDIKAIEVYKNEIYIAGFFQKSAGNVGNKIMKLGEDGWEEVGSGVVGENADIHDMIVFNDELYICGIFDYVGDGVRADNIAKWDGEKWCGLGSVFQNRILTMGIYNEELYIGGGFISIDDEPVKYIAKWIGGDYVDTCTEIVSSSHEVERQSFYLNISPNPATETLYLQTNCPGKGEGLILNAQGQVVRAFSSEVVGATVEIAIDHLPGGVYWVRWKNGDCDLVEKVVVF